MNSVSLAAILLFWSTLLSNAQSGRITGIVLSEDGQPITQASVCVSLVGSHKSECRVQTNEAGQFEIEHLSMGSFYVFAAKYEDGYPGSNQEKVVLSTQDPSANVTIKMPPKAGMLIGTVRDSRTGKPVHKLTVFYSSTEGKASGTAGTYDGGFKVDIPTTGDYIIVVTAPGYKSWVYIDPSDQSASIHLVSGEQKSVDIELVPR